MKNKTKRLGALGATALVALVVIGPMAGMANGATTTTTSGSTTSTTLPTQKSVHGSVTNTNHCVSTLDPPIQPGGATNIGVTLSTDAFPQPHEGDPIKLTNTKVTISIPATLLQVGVDANIITDGQVIPSNLKLAITGSGTTQGQHIYSIDSSVTVHVNNGVAQPLTASLNLPSTTWTPVNKSTDVFFGEKSMTITSTIDLTQSLGIVLTATFKCTPSGSAQVVAIGGLGAAGTTTTTAAPTTTAAGTVAPTTTPISAAAPAANTLPRTGSNAGWLIALAVACITAGLFALRSVDRRRSARTYQ